MNLKDILLDALEENPDVIIGLVTPWLQDNGYDGLVNTNIGPPDDPDGGCGCGFDELVDLCPCGSPDFEHCQPAYLWKDGLYRLTREGE